MTKKKLGIYAIKNVENGKLYVGSSNDLKTRWVQHRGGFRRGKHPSKKMQHSWNKYGESAFVFEILEEIQDRNHLIEREQYWMDKLHSYSKEAGFNSKPTAGPARGIPAARVVSAETRAKLSAARKARKMAPESIAKMVAAKRGKAISLEHRAKISMALKGRAKGPRSAEAKAKQSAKMRGRRISPDRVAKIVAAHLGSKRTAEQRLRMSAAQKGRKATATALENMRAGQQRRRARLRDLAELQI